MSSDGRVEAERQRVSALLDAWDPIGVYDHTDDHTPPGEYSRLVTPVLTRLRTGDDVDSISGYLVWDARTNMGLTHVAGAREAARHLIEWWQQDREGCR